ncbi:MAG: dual specificity protein phosphatase family protein [Myxococcales bacterium]|nr:dual specificity protein phosphatase family protein [Myxococcales bacterium]
MVGSRVRPPLSEDEKRRLAGAAQRGGFAWVDLTEATGSSPRTGLGIMCRPGRFSPLKDDLALLRSLGIEVIVDLTGGPVPESIVRGWTHHALPIRPMEAPTKEQIEHFCALVDERRAAGRSVLVHCEEGVGRAGTLATIYLIHRRAMRADDALRLLRRVRAIGQSQAQEFCVHAFARSRGYE